MAEQLDLICLQAIMDLREWNKGFTQYISQLGQVSSQTEQTAQKSSTSFKDMAKWAAGIGAAIGAAKIANELKSVTQEAAGIQTVRAAFQGLTGDAEGMLAKLRAGTSGMVADTELLKSYNSAAQLVGKTFADQLPGAMGYLSKVAQASGQDMGYMLDSLVKGVGRLSPMILDNLGIQVNLTEANDAYAKKMGKTTEEMTKAEQQTAMMNLVMAKLETNTANMPDAMGSAAQQIASFGTTMQNLRIELGTQLVPVLQTITSAMGEALAGEGMSAAMEAIGGAAQRLAGALNEILPRMVDLAAQALPALLTGFGELVWRISDVVSGIASLTTWFTAHFDPATVAAAAGAVAMALGIAKVIAAVQAMGGAMTILNTIMAANPIILIATAIAAAGLGIAAAVKKIKEANDELVTGTTETSYAVAQQSASYEIYQQKMLDYIREAHNVPPGMSDIVLALHAVDEGLMMGQEQWYGYTSLMNREAGPALEGLDEGLLSVGEQLRALKAPEEVFGGIRDGLMQVADVAPSAADAIRALEKDTSDGFLGMRVEGKKFEAAMQDVFAEAFDPKEAEKANDQFEKATTDHYNKLEKLQSNWADTQLDRQFNFNLDRAKAEQEYQTDRAILLEQGKADEVAQLDAKYAEAQAVAENGYNIESQMQERALLQQQVKQHEAYVAELTEQNDQNIRMMIAQLQANDKFLALEETQQNLLIATLTAGGSEALRNEYQRAADRIALEHAVTGAVLTEGENQVKAWLATSQTNLVTAQNGLADARKAYENFKIELPPISNIRQSVIGGERAGAAVGGAAGRAASTTARSSIASVSDELASLNKAITDATQAVAKLQGFEVPEGVEEGLARFKEFAKSAIITTQAAIKELNISATGMENATTFGSTISSIMGSIKEALETVVALSAWEKRDSVATQMADLVLRIKEIIPVLVTASRDLDSDGMVKAADIYNSAESIMGFIGKAIEGINDLAEWKGTKDLSDSIAALRARLGEVLPVLLELSAEYKMVAVTKAKEIFEAMGGVIGFLGEAIESLVDLSEWHQTASLTESAKRLRDRLAEVVPVLVEASHDYESEGLDAAAKIYESVLGVVGFISDAAKALSDLADWTIPKGDLGLIAQELVDQVIGVVGQIVIGVHGVVNINVPEAVAELETINKTVGNLWGGMTELVSQIGKGVEGLEKLAGWKTSKGDLSATAQALVIEVAAVVGQIVMGVNNLANIADPDAVAALNDINEVTTGLWLGMTALLEPVSKAIEALVALASYKPPEGDLSTLAFDFAFDLQQAIIYIERGLHGRPVRSGPATPIFEVPTEARTFMEAASEIVDVVKPAIDMLADLFRYTSRGAALGPQATLFAQDLDRVVRALSQGIHGRPSRGGGEGQPLWELEPDAQKFWEGVKTISDVIKPALDALAALLTAPTYDPVKMSARATNFGRAILAVSEALIAAQGTLDTEVYAAATGFWASVQSIIEVVSSGMEALTSLQPKDAKDKGWNAEIMAARATNFAAAVMGVTNALDIARGGLTAADLGESMGFWSAVQGAMETIASIITTLTENQTLSVAKATAQLKFNLGIIEKDVLEMLVRLGTLVPEANQFAADVAELQTAITAGLTLAAALGAMPGVGDPFGGLKAALNSFFTNPPRSLLDAAYSLGWKTGAEFEAGFRGALGIASPSTVMENLGAQMRAGLQQGFEQARVPYQGAATTNNYRNQSVSLAINANVASDVDVDALGRRVLQIVAQGMRV